MTKQTHVALENPQKASLLLASSVLAVICILPFLFVKFFHHPKPKQISVSSSPSPAKTDPTPEKEPPKKKESLNQPTPHAPTKPPVHVVITQPGDTLGRIFKRAGLSAKNLQQVMQSNPQSKLLGRLRPNQKLELTIKNHQLQKLIFPYSDTETLVVTQVQNRYEGTISKQPTTLRHEYLCATVRGSLYSTAKRHHVPFMLIKQMTTIFSRDIDFKKGIRSGDHFTILYTTHYIGEKQIKTGDILAVTYTNNNKTHEAVRYTNKDGSTNYYTPQGLSLNKSYDRYPVRFSHIASPFSLSRYHPILHYRRPHYGIDLAAPAGTPIHAIGDGRIEMIGRSGGYGNMIRIRHNNMYSTIYGHLSRFQKGLSKGTLVKRGQTIGYVGQTGLASGPHCHFEFHIHHQPKNPTTIQLPHGDPIPHKEMASFKSRVQTLLKELRSRSVPQNMTSTYASNKQKAKEAT